MDNLLRPRHSFSSAYIDDIVVYCSTWQEHLSHLKSILSTLRDAGLTVKLWKCTFAKEEVSFLGHTVGKGKLKPQEAKVNAVKTFITPKSKKDLRCFLGLVGYYRHFIKNFSSIAAPLTDLLKKGIPNKLPWMAQQQKSFEILRNALTSDTFLTTPDPCKEFTLQTDASSRGVGAVLSQHNDDGILRPVAFYSRKLLDKETKYTITELECLAIVNAVKHFDVYLLGMHFLIQTDHSALKHLESLKHGSPWLMRWALSLQPFSCMVHHRKGTLNANADSLSRQAWDSLHLMPVASLPKEGGVGDLFLRYQKPLTEHYFSVTSSAYLIII